MRMINKILKFLFPPPTIFITIFFFIVFIKEETLQTAPGTTFVFFVLYMLPFDLLVAFINWIRKGNHKKDSPKFNNTYSYSYSSQTSSSNTHFEKSKPNARKEKQKNNKMLEDFASLCVANCELDKEQNFINETTHGNVKYNDKRFDNMEDMKELQPIISESKIKEVSETIIQLYDNIGARVLIEETICCKPYIILKLVPMNGTRIDTILTFQNNIERAIKMATIMNVMYKKGYIGIVLPIHKFVKENEEG